ncbi:MAG: hypothetical protein K2Y14_04150 [Burkholderiales bacterium]|nr:hypothetical protein [Burkholderiales bacterium]
MGNTKLKLVKIEGDVFVYDLKDGRRIQLAFDLDNGCEVTELLSDNEEVNAGSISWEHNDEEYDGYERIQDERCHITHLNLFSGYIRQGIGTEIIRKLKEDYGCLVTFSDDDGIRRDDGSHLTGDGPAFVNSLKRNEIIEDINDEGLMY